MVFVIFCLWFVGLRVHGTDGSTLDRLWHCWFVAYCQNPTPSRQDKKDVSVEAEGGSGIVRIVNVTIVEPTSNQSCGFLDSSVTSNPFLGVWIQFVIYFSNHRLAVKSPQQQTTTTIMAIDDDDMEALRKISTTSSCPTESSLERNNQRIG